MILSWALSAFLALSASRTTAASFQRHRPRPVLPDETLTNSIDKGASEQHITDDSGAGVEYNDIWAGAVLSGTDLKAVSALVKIPIAAMPPGGRANVQYSTTTWVGIDGVNCATQALLQAGVDTFVQNGKVRFEGWYEWYPQESIPFPNFAVKAGDVINITVAAWSATTGIAILENHTTGKNVSHIFSQGQRLCFNTAEWIVEDFTQGTQTVDFANFTTVTFTNTTATTGAGKVLDNTGSQIFGIKQKNEILSDCGITDSSTVYCKYVSK